MRSFYQIFLDEMSINVFYQNTVKGYTLNSDIGEYVVYEVISQKQKESIEVFGNSLDVLDYDIKKEVAHSLVERLTVYNMEKYHYNHKNAEIYDKEEAGEKGRLDYSKKHKGDVKRAKDFRSTLQTHREKYGQIIDDYEPYRRFVDRANYEDMHPYFLMVKLVDEYIQDLETKTYAIADKDNYSNLPDKPSKQNISEYLKDIVRKYNIKGGVRKVNQLIKNLDKLY